MRDSQGAEDRSSFRGSLGPRTGDADRRRPRFSYEWTNPLGSVTGEAQRPNDSASGAPRTGVMDYAKSPRAKRLLDRIATARTRRELASALREAHEAMLDRQLSAAEAAEITAQGGKKSREFRAPHWLR